MVVNDLGSSTMTDTVQLNLVTDQPKKNKEAVKRPAPQSDVEQAEKKRKTTDKPPGQEKTKSHDGAGGEFISSLFNHNPEIPQLDFGNVEPVQETVFTNKSFKDIGIHPHLSKNLSDMGMENMTTVQSKAIPVIMAEKDVLVKSQVKLSSIIQYLQLRIISLILTVAILDWKRENAGLCGAHPAEASRN